MTTPAGRRTLTGTWIRHRFAGYLEFQARASAVLRDRLNRGEDHTRLPGRVNEPFTRSLLDI